MWGIPQEVIATGSDEAALQAVQDKLLDPGEFLARVGYLYEHPDEESRDEIRLKDGRTFDRYSAPVKSADGRLYGRVWYFRDITERKAAEEALRASTEELRESEARSSAVIEHALDCVITINHQGRVVEFNPAAEATFGYTRTEALGQDLNDLIVPPAFHEAHSQGIAHFLETGEGPVLNRRIEVPALRKDRTEIPVELAATAIPLSGPPLFTAYLRDITERKRAERELQAAKEAAEEANRSKSEFLSRMSHELRTPMNSILGFAQLLGRKPLPDDQRKSVDHILKAGRHLLDLINEVLDIARIEANRLQLSLEPVGVGGVLQEALSLIQPLAAQHGCRIEGADALNVGAYVLADRQRLLQVLLNLLSNAVKYNRPGGTVFLSCERVAGEAGERLSLRVRDTGPGIAPEDMARLFIPFERLGADQLGIEGTGLGLALSLRLVEAMGGALTAESVPGQGSTFVIALAPAENPLEQLERSGHPGATRMPGEDDVPPEKTAALLYIEDNLANLSLIETILGERPGVALLSALQGRLGLDLAEKHRPDLILLDLHLPDMAGDEVLARLRSRPETRDIPVIVVSADATPGSVERLLRAGARGYLTKPLDVEQFLGTIDEILEKEGARTN
jgi:PAS domain S-box-containing protein